MSRVQISSFLIQKLVNKKKYDIREIQSKRGGDLLYYHKIDQRIFYYV